MAQQARKPIFAPVLLLPGMRILEKAVSGYEEEQAALVVGEVMWWWTQPAENQREA